MFTKSLIHCEIITPKTVSDDVSLYPSGTAAELDLGKNPKPWLVYLNSSMSKSLSECWNHEKYKLEIGSMQKCLFQFQPSYKIIQKSLHNSCLVYNKKLKAKPKTYTYTYNSCFVLQSTRGVQPCVTNYYYTKILKAKSQTYITGSFKVSKNILNKIFHWYIYCIFFEFKLHATLRLNVTFLELNILGEREFASLYFERNHKPCRKV